MGDFSVRSYGLVLVLAILLEMGVAYFLARGTHYQKLIPNMIVYVVLGAIISERIWQRLLFSVELLFRKFI